MTVTSDRRSTGFTRALVLGGVAVVAATTLTACAGPHLPPRSATVTEVARAYVEAAKAKDCATTKALTASDAFAWCDNPRLLGYRLTGRPFVAPGHGGVRTTTCVPMELTSKGTDEAITFDGTIPWEFCFVETADGWRVWDQGQG